MSEGYPNTTLGSLASITMGQSPGSETYTNEEQGLPFLQGCAEFGARHPVPAIYCDPPLRVGRKGSVLISVRAPVGTMNVADQDYCIGRGLGAITGIPGSADTSFLRYSIEHNVHFLHRRSQGSTFLAIGSADLKLLPVPDVGPEAQERISEVLTRAEEAIDRTESLIAKYQQIKAGLMHDLFTRGVTADGKLRPPREQAPELYQETPIGWIPKDWSAEPLEGLLAPVANNLRSGPFGSALVKSELVEEGVPFLGIDNIFREYFEPTYRRFVSNKKYLELNRYAVRPRDVVITIMGTVGRCCVLPEDVAPALSSKHLWTMTLDQGRVIPELVCWQLNYAPWVLSWFRRESQGAVMDAIQSSTLRTLRLPVPPMEEQEAILRKYMASTSKIDSERKTLRKLQNERRGLMGDLLSGKVRVPIEAVSPEPASA